MDTREARELLRQHLARFRARTYGELVQRVGAEPEVLEANGASGTRYQLEFEVLWDNAARGDLRVLGGIDDGGLRSFVPLCDSFILASDGSFVGE